jgi:hypothetical protein
MGDFFRKHKWFVIAGGSAVVVICALGCVGCVAGVGGGGVFWWKAGAQARLEKRVLGMIEGKEGTKINRVLLIRKTATEYDGMVYAEDGREATVQVVCDGDRVLAKWQWQLRR